MRIKGVKDTNLSSNGGRRLMGETHRLRLGESQLALNTHPAIGHPSLLITQGDVTSRAETEVALSLLNEASAWVVYFPISP